MEYNLAENLEYCYQFFVESQALLLYTHIPPLVFALLFSAYVLYKQRGLPSILFMTVTVIFSVFSIIDLLQWIFVGNNTFIVASWALLGLLSSLMFFFLFWLTHHLLTQERIPRWVLAVWAVALIPVLVLSPTMFNIEGYDIRDCIALEGVFFTNYYYGLGVLSMVLMAISAVRGLRMNRRVSKSAKILILIGAELFTLTFLVTGVLASYLVESGLVPDFGLAQYGIGAMAIFIGLLGYATVQYNAFSINTFATQILVITLVILVGAELLFVNTLTNAILVGLTLLLVILFGWLLIRSVKREVEQRKKIEILAKELEEANAQQVTLIHFITHQIKGFVTKSRNIFSMALEGDFGEVNGKLRPMLQEGFDSDTKGASVIQEILNAANIKSGKVSFTMAPFDLRELIQEIASDLRSAAEAKGLTLTLALGDSPATISGDKMQLVNVFRNLIDNSIKYTPSGKVDVAIEKREGKLLFSVKDTGVGITPEDMKCLFTEGGHGKESTKVNVESTGFGLYIVKNIVVAHKGRVWAESEGAGKGSQFYVEIPEK